LGLCVSICLAIGLAAQNPPFTDNPLVPGVTVVKAEHVTQVRARINALRVLVGLGVFPFTDPITPGVTPVTAAQLVELRAALGEAACKQIDGAVIDRYDSRFHRRTHGKKVALRSAAVDALFFKFDKMFFRCAKS
jgi:hypothetical protein